jgi:hypothetical protein
LPGLLRDFEPDGPTCLPLTDHRPIQGVASRSDVFDPQAYDIATAKLAIDRDVEHGQITSLARHLESRPDGPNVLRQERRLRSGQLSFVPRRGPMRDLLGYGIDQLCILHVHSPLFETSGLLLHLGRSIPPSEHGELQSSL